MARTGMLSFVALRTTFCSAVVHRLATSLRRLAGPYAVGRSAYARSDGNRSTDRPPCGRRTHQSRDGHATLPQPPYRGLAALIDAASPSRQADAPDRTECGGYPVVH